MENKDSFDSASFSGCETEEVETKERTHEREEEDEQKHLSNIELINTISQILITILEDNKTRQNYNQIITMQNKSVFNSVVVPKISIKDYLIRIQSYANMEKNTLIISLIYIDRLCKSSNLLLTYYNIHKILFTAILISIKYNEDHFYDNKYYSEIAGVKLKELKLLEYTFAKTVNFHFFVKNDFFEKYEMSLDNYVQ